MGAQQQTSKKKEEEKVKIIENGIIFAMKDSSGKKVPFIFAYENDDMFLGEKNDINDNYHVKIKEFFKEESDQVVDSYYINKEKMKEKYLNPLLVSKSEYIINDENMEELYKKNIKTSKRIFLFFLKRIFLFWKMPFIRRDSLIKFRICDFTIFQNFKIINFIFLCNILC